jgi:hypothetical protein
MTLFEALYYGKTLVRQHDGGIETIHMERTPTGYSRYIRSGWGSKVGTVEDVLNEIYRYPEYWEILLDNLDS